MNNFYFLPFINVIIYYDAVTYSTASLPLGKISLRAIKCIDFMVGFLWFSYRKSLYREK